MPSTYEQICELRETGLINIIQNSRNRFLISENENKASQTLSEVLKLYPPLLSIKNEENGYLEQNTPKLNEDHHPPVKLSGWLIEPPIYEIERITI